jgi:hypothetical protein
VTATGKKKKYSAKKRKIMRLFQSIVKNEIELISKSDQRRRTTKVWEYVKAKRELFINVGEKVLKLFLGAGY